MYLMRDLRFELTRWYYKFMNPSAINHYNLVNKLVQLKRSGEAYVRKYPNAQPFVNLNEELFSQIPQAKADFLAISKEQKQLTQTILNDIDHICKNNANDTKTTSCDLCLPTFQQFYVNRSYHIGQFTDEMIRYIKSDRCLHQCKFTR
jgi:hypothetical protein